MHYELVSVLVMYRKSPCPSHGQFASPFAALPCYRRRQMDHLYRFISLFLAKITYENISGLGADTNLGLVIFGD